MLITGTDYLTLRSIDMQYWPEEAKTAADLWLTYPTRVRVLNALVVNYGTLIAREWLARNIQSIIDFHAEQL